MNSRFDTRSVLRLQSLVDQLYRFRYPCCVSYVE
jgi:hypothetical protein